MLRLLCVISLFSGSFVYSYPGGAPEQACETLLPEHMSEPPQEEPSPYIIEVDNNNVNGGDVLKITITSTDETIDFKGFIIQAREQIDTYKTIGEFNFDTNLGKSFKCLNDADTVTHTSRDSKKSVTFNYIPPKWFDGEIILT